jgi:tartrate dehydratase beta subunit/fumarate hydratase class I family protein
MFQVIFIAPGNMSEFKLKVSIDAEGNNLFEQNKVLFNERKEYE